MPRTWSTWRLTAGRGEAWWTLGFEATGPAEVLRMLTACQPAGSPLP